MAQDSALSTVERLSIEIEQEVDGRWIAEVVALPGVMVYGATREEAVLHVKALALQVLLDRSEQIDTPPLTLHYDLC